MVWRRSRIVNAKITLGLSWCVPRRHEPPNEKCSRNPAEGRKMKRREGNGEGGRGMREGERVGGEKGKRAKERRRWC